MKLLITGGCGFLGSNLASHALSLGMDVCVFDNLHRHGSHKNLQWLRANANFEFFRGDVRNFNEVNQVISRMRPETVFHLAGQVAMTTSVSNPRADFEVNALGTLNVLEAVRAQAPNSVIIYSSTNKVYGDLEQFKYVETGTRYISLEHPNGFDEQTPLDFHTPYGCSKGSADQYLRDYHRTFGLNTIVFRHSSMYGGRQFSTEDQGWVGWFCQLASEIRAGKLRAPFNISGNGKQVRDVVSVDDVVSLYFSTIAHANAAAGQAFNVGGGIKNSLSLLELFLILESEIGQPLYYKSLPPRKSDQRIFVSDIQKVTNLTGWKPQLSTQAGVKKMFNWVDQCMR
jgi:CDP-paratose 2-epimerase